MSNILLKYSVEKGTWLKDIMSNGYVDFTVGFDEDNNYSVFGITINEDETIKQKMYKEYPTGSDAYIVSSKINLDYGKIVRVKVNYANVESEDYPVRGENPSLVIKVYNEKFTDGYKEYEMTDIIKNEWMGVPGGYIGEYIQFTIKNTYIFKSLTFEYVKRGD